MTVAAVLALIGAAGCHPMCAGESPCTPPFYVNTWCGETDECTLGAQAADCYSGGCRLDKHEVLSIPIWRFSAQLEGIHDLSLAQYVVSADEIDLNDVVVLLDGTPGQHVLVAGSRHSVQWYPFPASPQLLELSYDSGTADFALVGLMFEDFACEDAFDPCD